MIFDNDSNDVGGRMNMKQNKTVSFKAPKPFTRKPIKPRQAHKIATRYSRKAKHGFGDAE